eukprot:jgi/Chlat1/7701/Chrsp64S07136
MGDEGDWSPVLPAVANLPAAALPKASVKQLTPHPNFTGTLRRLHLNECPYPPSPKVQEAIRKAAETVNLYPDPRCEELASALAARLQGIAQLNHDSSGGIVIPDPSFPRYAASAAIFGAEVVRVPVTSTGCCDASAMLATVTSKTRALFVANPNNPTGGMMTEAELQELAVNAPENVLLVLDEAYYEFARAAGGPDGLRLLLKHRRKGPWIVTRTFSKAFGMAGLRVGYAVFSSASLASNYLKLSPIFPMCSLSEPAALAALADEAYSVQLVGRISQERERMSSALRQLGLEPLPSFANFVAVKVSKSAMTVIQELAGRGVFIGPIRSSGPAYNNYIRIGVGTLEDTDAVIAALKEALM